MDDDYYLKLTPFKVFSKKLNKQKLYDELLLDFYSIYPWIGYGILLGLILLIILYLYYFNY